MASNPETTPGRCPQCGQVGVDDCERGDCAWEQWSDGTPITAEQKAAGAAWAEGVNAWLAERETNRG